VGAATSFTVTTALLRPVIGVLFLLFGLSFDWSNQHASSAFLPATVAIVIAVVAGLAAAAVASRVVVPKFATVALLGLLPIASVVLYTMVRSTIPLSGGLTHRDSPALGLACASVGGILIAQQLLPASPAWGTRWRLSCLALLVASGIWGTVSVASVVHDTAGFAKATGELGSLVAMVLVLMGMVVVIPLWFGIQIARRRAADWAAGMILGAAFLVGLPIFAHFDEGSRFGFGGGHTDSLGMGMTLFLLGLASGSSTQVAAQLQPVLRGASGWLQTAAGLMVISALILIMVAIVAATVLHLDSSTSVIATLVFSLAAAVIAVVCRTLLSTKPQRGRLLAAAWAIPLTVVTLSMQGTSAGTLYRSAAPGQYAMTMVPLVLLPIAVAVMVTVPPSVRGLGPLLGSLGQPVPLAADQQEAVVTAHAPHPDARPEAPPPPAGR